MPTCLYKCLEGLSTFGNFAIGFTEVAILPSVITTFNQGLISGGPVIIVWGFFIASVMTMLVSLSMAEICSAYPSTGCVYYWAASLSPPKYAPLASYICGWCNFIGNAAGDASFASSFTGLMNAAIIMSDGVPYNTVEQVFISILVLFIWSLLGIFRVDKVGYINSFAAVFHFLTIGIIMFAVIASTGTLNTNSFVFETFNNDTGFSSMSYVSAIGIVVSVYCFSGYEASAHMAEETLKSRSSAPIGILTTSFATAVGGLVLFITLLYATHSIPDALNGPTGYAGINVFLGIDRTLARAITWLVVVNCFFAGLSSVAVTARITYALARDNGFPCSKILSQLHSTFFSPMHAIMFVFAFDAVLLLLPLDDNGAVAFYSIIGLTVVGFQTSYAIPILLKIIFNPTDFPTTPFSLGRLSTPCGVLSCLWLLGTSMLTFLPTESPVSAFNMNWLIVVVAILFVISLLNWIFNSRFHFQGPKRYSSDARVESFDTTMSNPIVASASSASKSSAAAVQLY